MSIINWLKSWQRTGREWLHYVRAHPQMVILNLLGGYMIVFGVLLFQYFTVQATPAETFLKYEPVIVSDVDKGYKAIGKFVRSSQDDYHVTGYIEFGMFGIKGEEGGIFSPPPIAFPKYIKKGTTKESEYIPTDNLQPGKYSFTLVRSFCVSTWSGICVPKQVIVVSDKFEVKP